MTIITDELISTTNDYNLFLFLKKNMIKGEIRLSNLSSKNRSVLHTVCYNYGLEHFSTGNYKNRTLIIKDNTHTYFTSSNPLHIVKSEGSLNRKPESTYEYNFIDNIPYHKTFTNSISSESYIQNNKEHYENEHEDEHEDEQEDELDEDEQQDEDEQDEDEQDEDEQDEDEQEDEDNTDTYSSDESVSSEDTKTYQLMQNINISNQLNTLRIFSYINLILNVIVICNI